MKKSKPTFNEMVNKLKKDKPLKQVTPEVELPYFFDMMWDAKVGADLNKLAKNKPDLKKQVAQALSIQGFDAQSWLKQVI